MIDDDTGTITLQLRSERDGTGDDRTYTITITATDSSGNQAETTVTVTVPHDEGESSDVPNRSGASNGDDQNGGDVPRERAARLLTPGRAVILARLLLAAAFGVFDNAALGAVAVLFDEWPDAMINREE